MKNFPHTPRLLSAAVLAALATLPIAALAQPSGWYAGAAVGRSAATIDDARITSGLQAQGLATSSITDRDRDTGYKLFGGYQMTPNFALEAGLFDLGRFGYTATTVPAGTLGGNIGVKGLNLDLVGSVPLAGKLSAFGRVGVISERTRGSFSATGAAGMPYASANPSKHSTGAKFGAGLAYDFTERVAMRVEAERYRIHDAVGNKGHIDLLSVGLLYRFGAAPAPRAAAPEPVVIVAAPAPAPVPAPVVVPPPVVAQPAPAPVPVRVSLSADSLFDFDRSVVKPAGRQALDRLAGDLKTVQYDTVKVIGHTDRLGSTAYNQKLSTRRAEAVGAYLVQSGGVAAAKVSTSGVGETQPVTATGHCSGSKPTAALVACLQPDRRVDVEVSGQK